MHRRSLAAVLTVALAVAGLAAAGHAQAGQAEPQGLAEAVLTVQPPAFLPNGKPTPKHSEARRRAHPNRRTAGVHALPPAPSTSAKAAGRRAPSPVYQYAGMRQAANTKGAYANFYIFSPYLSTQDYHTLAEIAVQDATKNNSVRGNVVEVGWTVDRTVNGGSDQTHIFVGNWVNSTFGCYNGCGWVDYGPNTTVDAGTNIEALGHANNTAKNMGIQYENPSGVAGAGVWWVWYDTDWLGYYPESDWNGATFNKTDLVQMFGEIVVNDDTAVTTDVKCSDMGSGAWAATGTTQVPNAARIAGATYVGPTTAEPPAMSTFQTDGARWTVNMPAGTTRSVYFGGPGSNSTGTTVPSGAIGSC